MPSGLPTTRWATQGAIKKKKDGMPHRALQALHDMIRPPAPVHASRDTFSAGTLLAVMPGTYSTHPPMYLLYVRRVHYTHDNQDFCHLQRNGDSGLPEPGTRDSGCSGMMPGCQGVQTLGVVGAL